MAKRVEQVILGIDVSQGWLDICVYGQRSVERIDNRAPAIKQVLRRWPQAAIAVEATNTFHELLVEQALALGLRVYVINGYQLSHYAKSLGQRMRNDPIDAQLLARYLAREIDQLRPLAPRQRQVGQIRRLLKRRALLVGQATQLRLSFAGMTELKTSVASLQRRLREVIALIERRIACLAKQLAWQSDLKRLQQVPGIGPLTAYGLLAAYHSGQFNHRNQYIAFLGLDVRTKDSGKHRGRRKLSKQGDGEIRRLLYNAAMAASRTPLFEPAYTQARVRGYATTAALVIIARKLARVAFGLLRHQRPFDPARVHAA